MRNKELPGVVKPELIPALSPEQRQIDEVLLSGLKREQRFLYLLRNDYPLLSDDLQPVFLNNLNGIENILKTEFNILKKLSVRYNENEKLFFVYSFAKSGDKETLDAYELRHGQVVNNDLSKLVNVCRFEVESKRVISSNNPNLPHLTEGEERFAEKMSETILDDFPSYLVKTWLKKLKLGKQMEDCDYYGAWRYIDIPLPAYNTGFKIQFMDMKTLNKMVDKFLKSIPRKCKMKTGFDPRIVPDLVYKQVINRTTSSGVTKYREIYEEMFGDLRKCARVLQRFGLNEKVEDFYKRHRV